MSKIALFSFYGRSGMWHYATQYCNALSSIKKVIMICPKYAKKELLNKNIKYHKIKARPNVISFLIDSINFMSHITLMKKIMKENTNILHFLDNHPWTIAYMMFFKILGKKIIVTQHDPIQHTGEPRSILQNLINKIQRKLADNILVHGTYLKNKLVSRYGINKDKIVVYTHGNYEFIKDYDTKQIKTERNTFLFFGRIIKYKGLDLLLDALKYLKKKGINFKLIIAGSGDLTPYLNKINSVRRNIEIINKFLDESEIPPLFKRSRFVVLPYRDASQTGIIPIAYAYKKPVLVTNTGALPETVNNKTGLVVEPDSEDIAKGLIRMLKYNNKFIKKIGNNAYRKMKKDLNWRKNILKIKSIYEK